MNTWIIVAISMSGVSLALSTAVFCLWIVMAKHSEEMPKAEMIAPVQEEQVAPEAPKRKQTMMWL